MALQEAAAGAARALSRARALLVTAGAGMGVDSGLPDFRGTEGLWREYPPLKHLQLDFADMASPDWFQRDPCFAWGFYGHRLLLYRRTVPHEGFGRLLRWGERMPRGSFVFTSNVDGQFQRAGFGERSIVECHGSIHFLQGLGGGPVVPADGVAFSEIDPSTLRVPKEELPEVEGSPARPNILMFGDWGWEGGRTKGQQRRLARWLEAAREPRGDADADADGGLPVVVVEMGAGEAVPTVRRTSEQLARRLGGALVRINPRESQVSPSYCLYLFTPTPLLLAPLLRQHTLLVPRRYSLWR